MTTTMEAKAPGGTLPDTDHHPAPGPDYIPSGAPAPATVTRKVTPTAPCGGGCGTPVSRRNSTGLCRPCWLTQRRRPMSKTEADHQVEFLTEMITSRGHHAAGEDPGIGLAGLLALARHLSATIREVGIAVTDRDGVSLVAHEIGVVPQVVSKRWGGQRRA